MNQWIKIAFRNIRKNRRRSVVTILAVAVGFAAAGLFRGYTANTYDGLRQSAIRGEGLGHLTIYKAGWLENGQNDPEHTLLTAGEIRKIIAVAKTDPDVRLATPQLSVSGLVANGRTSHIFLAMGVVPFDYRTIAGPMAARRPVTGKPLDGGTPYGILMADKLARLLTLKPDSDAVIMANTLDGQMNALDIRVNGTYDTGAEATSDKYLLLPYAYAQKLYDTDRADRIVVLLDDWQHTQAARARLSRNLAAAGLHCEIKTWNELSVFYGKVRIFGGVIAFFFFSRKEIAQTRELADQERIQRLTSEKQTVQTQLKLLQAQIEPHFLFNTLSTIASLLDTDVAAGKSMLTDLTRYLRASLTTTRADQTTLGTELELVAAYLNILKGRMGRRLRVAIDIPEDLKPLPLAPMLIQPLVENAVIHGIDPQIEGGALEIHAHRNQGAVEIVVTDTGRGFTTDSQGGGMGITNVRDRLAALYGDKGRLRFTENRPSGVRATIEVPYADNLTRHHRR